MTKTRTAPEANTEEKHVGQRQLGDTRPDRAICLYCGRVIQRAVGSPDWTVGLLGLEGRGRECYAAPNSDDGPMPGHIHDGTIVHPPSA